MVSQLTQNFPSMSKSMLHSMEGKFYVGFLEVHNPNPNPNHMQGGGGDIKFPLHGREKVVSLPMHINFQFSPPWEE